jgi:hypothetical protein
VKELIWVNLFQDGTKNKKAAHNLSSLFVFILRKVIITNLCLKENQLLKDERLNSQCGFYQG